MTDKSTEQAPTQTPAPVSNRDDAMDRARLFLALGGVALIGYGAWLHYPPAGFITAGALLFGVAVVGAVRAR
ncbi:Phage protein [Azospirillum argentinense]|uniref:hypothetical protein n=1 Tax=Azospirillum argentinense TaxID=2970906 RepID=UPI0032DF9320